MDDDDSKDDAAAYIASSMPIDHVSEDFYRKVCDFLGHNLDVTHPRAGIFLLY